MVALRGKDINSFLARPDPARPIILLYGPDAGLIRERADALMASAVDDPNDPFSLVRLSGDEQTIPRKAYVFATGWQPTPFPRFAEKAKAAGWDYHEADCDHFVMGNRPELTAEVLLGLAR